jgi:hypothetical protein
VHLATRINTLFTDSSLTIRTFGVPTDGTMSDNTQILVWDNVAITKAADFVLPVPEPFAIF